MLEGVSVSAAQPSAALVESFAEMTTRLNPTEGYAQSVRRVTETATHVITGCEAASITLLRRGVVVTEAATSELAALGDSIQYEAGEGPCLDAAMQERWVYTRDLATSPRWPKSAARLYDELGVRSMLACRLALDAAPKETLGALNMYSTKADGFNEDDLMLGVLLSSLGAHVIEGSRQQDNLRKAIESRQMIGEAVGILRAQSNVSSAEAFAMLAQASQRMNVKLRDVAAQVADSLGKATPHPVEPGADPRD